MNVPVEYDDDVKRFHDGVAFHLTVDQEQAINSWVAVRLSDGKVSGELFDSRADAIRHQAKESEYFYILIPATGMTMREAEAVLRVNRQLAAQGMRLSDPDLEPVMPVRNEEIGRPQLVRPADLAKLQSLLAQMESLLESLPPGAERQWWEKEYARMKRIITSGR